MFRRSSHCGASGCLEVEFLDEFVLLRSSHMPALIIQLTIEEWRSFIKGAKEGEFDR